MDRLRTKAGAVHAAGALANLEAGVGPFLRRLAGIFITDSPDAQERLGVWYSNEDAPMAAATGSTEGVDALVASWTTDRVENGGASPSPKRCACDGHCRLWCNVLNATLAHPEKPAPVVFRADEGAGTQRAIAKNTADARLTGVVR